MSINSFIDASNLILACHITGVHDVNRNRTLKDNDYELVKDWAASIADCKQKGIIFHNNFSEETCEQYQNEYILFVRIAYAAEYNPNVYRYFVYKKFLQPYINRIQNIFITDVTDVVLVKNPFSDAYFLEHPEAIFCGDEPKTLDDDWMKAHSAHLRDKIRDFTAYESKFAEETLLNCGIIGGSAALLFDFIEKLCAVHSRANCNNLSAFTGDMGVFNYVARTQFNRQLIHGAPINTVFKSYENERKDCWFRHK